MTTHKAGTREEWLAARLELLKAEKELTWRQRFGVERSGARRTRLEKEAKKLAR
jgi:predicted dithiol-disulfide oxidoreductase (DUF899 family)